MDFFYFLFLDLQTYKQPKMKVHSSFPTKEGKEEYKFIRFRPKSEI